MSSKPDVTIWCVEGHLVQKFRWLVGEGVWEPMRLQGEVTHLYPGNSATAPLIVNPDAREDDWELGPTTERMKWPMRCRPRPGEKACKVNNPLRAERATLALNLLASNGVKSLPLPEFLDAIDRLFPPPTRS